jgi:hypothetical protein
MPRSNGTIHVEEVPGELLRYRVESWSNPDEPHLVDLAEHECSGACSCESFSFTKSKAIKEGKPLHTRLTQCRHVRAARRFFAVKLLREIALKRGTL